LIPKANERLQEELKRRLASGEIKEDEYWEELRLLERTDDSGYHQKRGVFNKALTYRAQRTVLYSGLIIGIWLLVYLLFFYYPVPEGISISVKGAGIMPAASEEKEAIYRGFNLIKERSPEDYRFVDAYVDKVEVAGPPGLSLFGRIRGYYSEGPEGFGRNIRIVRGFECPAHCSEDGWNGRDFLIAEFIIHEACHSMQYHTGAEFSEQQCYDMQFRFAENVGPMLWEDFKRDMFIYEHSAAGLGF
jgi:hypothetical protein